MAGHFIAGVDGVGGKYNHYIVDVFSRFTHYFFMEKAVSHHEFENSCRTTQPLTLV